jgi:hypothetical protein
MCERSSDKLGFNESITEHSEFHPSDVISLKGMLKIKSSSGEKVYYE